MVQESTALYFQVFSFCWSANKIVGFLLAALVFVAGVGFIVSFYFPLAALLAAAVILLIGFGFAPRESTCSNPLHVTPLEFSPKTFNQSLTLTLLLLFSWLPCVQSFFCGVTGDVGSATAADLRCGDSVIDLAPLVVPFCTGAAVVAVCFTKPTSVSTGKTIAVVSIAFCLGLVAELIVLM